MNENGVQSWLSTDMSTHVSSSMYPVTTMSHAPCNLLLHALGFLLLRPPSRLCLLFGQAFCSQALLFAFDLFLGFLLLLGTLFALETLPLSFFLLLTNFM